jgi:RHS repeat-associated protein
VEDLRYTYDPAGNITRIEDAALRTIFHDGQQVEPACEYVYDAIYRLIEARGREHIGQTMLDLNPSNGNLRDYPFAGSNASPNDLQALRNYTERYEYDAAGNFEFMRHIANGGSWTRNYEYNEVSLIEFSKQNNRLTRTMVGNGLNHVDTYTYKDLQSKDVHGCMTAMNSMQMEWDFKDQLQKVDLGGGGTAYYVYDAGGQRVRKVIETQNGTLSEERLYLGGLEIYRKVGTNALIRETLHIMDDKHRIALVETKTVEDGSPIDVPLPVQRYQLGNHLGSASLELDKDGGLISYEEYYPYGTTAYQAMNAAAEVSLKRYRYTGKERDEETGFHYHGARYYAAWLGRWISVDPAGMVEGTNLYDYVRENPVGFVDPNGLADEDVDDEGNPVALVTLGGETKAISQSLDAAPGVAKVTPVFDATAPAQAQRNLDKLQQIETDAEEARQADNAKLYEELHRDDPDKTPLPEGGNPLRGAAKEVWNQSLGLAVLFTYVVQLTSPEAWEAGPEARAALQAQRATIENRGEALGAAAAIVAQIVVPEAVAARAGAKAALESTNVLPITAGSTAQDIQDLATAMLLRTGQSEVSLGPGTLTYVDELTVIAHGNSNAIALRLVVGQRTISGLITPREFAHILVESGWKGGTLRLGACETGLPDALTGVSFAEELSRHLADLGSPSAVIAPKGFVSYEIRTIVNGSDVSFGLPSVGTSRYVKDFLPLGKGWDYFVY